MLSPGPTKPSNSGMPCTRCRTRSWAVLWSSLWWMKRSRRIRKSRSRANSTDAMNAQSRSRRHPGLLPPPLEHPGARLLHDPMGCQTVDPAKPYRRGRPLVEERPSRSLHRPNRREAMPQPQVRRKTPCAEGRPRSASHLGKTLRGKTPHEPRAVTKPREPPRERRPAPGNVFLTHAQSNGDNQGSTGRKCTWRVLGRHQTGAGRLVRYS